MNLLSVLLRHLLACAVTTAVAAVVFVLSYLFLLAWALLSDAGIGSPLALPLGLLTVVLMVLMTSIVLFFPATLLAELICWRNKLPTIRAGIPITCALVAAFIFLGVNIVAAFAPPADSFPPATAGGALFVTMLLPLGCYWWTSQFPTFLKKGFLKIKQTIESRP